MLVPNRRTQVRAISIRMRLILRFSYLSIDEMNMFVEKDLFSLFRFASDNVVYDNGIVNE